MIGPIANAFGWVSKTEAVQVVSIEHDYPNGYRALRDKILFWRWVAALGWLAFMVQTFQWWRLLRALWN